MRTAGEIIRDYRKKEKISAVELAELLEVSQTFISYVEKGERRVSEKILNVLKNLLSESEFEELVKAEYEASAPDFIKKEMEQIEEKTTEGIPFFKNFAASAGLGNYNFEESSENIEYLEVPKKYQKSGYVAIKVAGDSMYPELQDDDIIIINSNYKIPNKRNYFVVEYKNEIYVKGLKMNDEGLVIALMSENRYYSPLLIEEIEAFRILGKVESIYCRDYNRKQII